MAVPKPRQPSQPDADLGLALAREYLKAYAAVERLVYAVAPPGTRAPTTDLDAEQLRALDDLHVAAARLAAYRSGRSSEHERKD